MNFALFSLFFPCKFREIIEPGKWCSEWFKIGGGRLKFYQRSEPGQWRLVGERIILMYIRIVQTSTRPEAVASADFQGVGDAVIIDGPPIPLSRNYRRSVDGFLD